MLLPILPLVLYTTQAVRATTMSITTPGAMTTGATVAAITNYPSLVAGESALIDFYLTEIGLTNLPSQVSSVVGAAASDVIYLLDDDPEAISSVESMFSLFATNKAAETAYYSHFVATDPGFASRLSANINAALATGNQAAPTGAVAGGAVAAAGLAFAALL